MELQLRLCVRSTGFGFRRMAVIAGVRVCLLARVVVGVVVALAVFDVQVFLLVGLGRLGVVVRGDRCGIRVVGLYPCLVGVRLRGLGRVVVRSPGVVLVPFPGAILVALLLVEVRLRIRFCVGLCVCGRPFRLLW